MLFTHLKKVMRLDIVLFLQLHSTLSAGIQSTFELLTQRNNDLPMFGYQEAATSAARHDECAAQCARNPRCSIFKYDILTSMCTTLAPDRFNWVSLNAQKVQDSVYACTDRGRCPVEKGYIFLRDVQMCIWVSPQKANNDSAVIQCDQHGGRLLFLSDSNRWEIISKMSLDPLITGLADLVLVGADDSTVPGTYVWGDGHPVSNSLWQAGEPTTLTEHCVSISNGALYDVPCSMELNFICEIPK